MSLTENYEKYKNSQTDIDVAKCLGALSSLDGPVSANTPPKNPAKLARIMCEYMDTGMAQESQLASYRQHFETDEVPARHLQIVDEEAA